MALYTSYDQVGKAEDVSDIISNISPTKTPFVSSIGDDKVTARLFEWQEDSLRAVQVNANLEGFTAADATLTATTSRTNVTQILEKTIKVSMTSDAVKLHGRAKETAYQLAKASEEVKRDLEHAMVGLLQAAVTGDAATARKFASAASQIHADTTTAGGTSALTEAMVLANHQAVYNAGADPSIFMIKPADSIIVANFAAVANTRIRDYGDGTKIVNAVKLYVSPFGELKVVLNRFMKTTNAITYDPAMWKRAVLRNWSRTLLAKVGDNESHMIVGEFSLKHMNQKASGLINALT
jgi:hypothetical protein